MRVAVLKETRSTENRVALVPLGVKALVKRGLTVTVQSGAGETSGISDLIYQEAGAEIAINAQDTLKDAEVVLVVNPPPSNELDLLSEGSILVGFL
ncbi:MAG TPA: NAD(P)(+) transhydrogenase (Re/Si-specific) subunit alpha, partial [Gemmatimonadetes bacterium]|nr:NAD(P)(+) transhydrogenase (Re/Si-specific) subunit alpha [Gemmatimonadota bacterium]